MDVFQELISLVKTSKQDAESFSKHKQTDMMKSLENSYNIMEKYIKYLKKLLKEPELDQFPHHKKAFLG